MTKLSVNINKFATLRNARGGNNPNVVQVAIDCQQFGADGITVHPRPDERHIRYQDVYAINDVVRYNEGFEFNIEGNPVEEKFMKLVLDIKPTQVTLVPDAIGQLTSNHGWDTLHHVSFLKKCIARLKEESIRVSIFIDPLEKFIKGAAQTGTDRVELYTEAFAKEFKFDEQKSVSSYVSAAAVAFQEGLGINAGHDLDLKNLRYFAKEVSPLQEVSIGHALVCDALYLGLENTIQLYKRCLLK